MSESKAYKLGRCSKCGEFRSDCEHNNKTMKKQTFENEVYVMPRTKRTDYLWYVTKTSTKEQRRKFDIGDIFINAAVCVKCKEYIRSINRHDYVECSCGAVAVDGGSWYAKRHGDDENRVDIIEGFEDK